MKRKLWRLLAITGAGVHLIIAALSSAKIPAWDYLGNGTAGGVAVLYAYMSGVGNHYGFFAPGVQSQLRVDYTCLRGEREIARGRFSTANSETRFRWHNIVENFWLSQDKEDIRRSQAASIAGKILARHPDAEGVRLSVKAFALPSMREYSEGRRPFWEEHYSVVFRRSQLADRGAAR